MNHSSTTGIVLSRTNYGEADRIITLLTPDYGKLRCIAKGARRPKSKLASGVELFCVSQISYIKGKSDLMTLTSTRVEESFDSIVQDIERTMYAYEVFKCIATITEDEAGEGYYRLLVRTLKSLNDATVPLAITSVWFDLAILDLTGHQPNLHTDAQGNKLTADGTYVFSFDDMSFAPKSGAGDSADLIKFLRLAIASDSPQLLIKVSGVDELLPQAKNLANTMRKHTLRV